MGRVYRARDTRLGRIVALKFILTRPEDRHRQFRFLREARVEAALSHPNIATILDVGEAEIDHPEISPPSDHGVVKGPVPFLVLEFVPGQDLASLAHEGPLSAGELLRIARQIAAGLQSAHTAGVVHRDLKPANIRITPDGLVKILDFGLARFEPGAGPTSDALHEFATTEGSVVGTVPYLAPEQAAGQPVDARADLFSLGVLLYELASGQLPFRGATTVERLRAVLRDDPPPLAPLAPQVPERFARLVHRMLDKDPAMRPQTARDIEHEIDAIARSLTEAQTSLSLPDGTPAAMPATTRRFSRLASSRRWVLLTIAVVLVAVGAMALFLDRRNSAGAERLLAQGRIAEEMSDPQAARIAAGLYEQATRLRPGLVAAWAELSRALANAYERDRLPELLERAGQAAENALELDSDSTDARLASARMKRLRGDTSAAIATLQSIPRQDAARDRVERELAEAWAQAGKASNAEEHLLAAVAAAPTDWRHWNALGRFRTSTGNLPGAHAAFDKATALAPAGVTIPQENLASVLFLEGKYAEAQAAYEKIEGPVASADTASNLGTLHYFNSQFAEAERDYRRAIQIAPREASYHRNLADTLLRLDRPEEARTEYGVALRLVDDLLRETPKDADLRLARALYLARAGQCDEALDFTEKLDRELPKSAMTAFALARPLALCGSSRQAIEKLREAVALGFPAAQLGIQDELAPLRGDPKFDRLAGQAATRGTSSR
jgi:Flp pilus assembly protein TadD